MAIIISNKSREESVEFVFSREATVTFESNATSCHAHATTQEL